MVCVKFLSATLDSPPIVHSHCSKPVVRTPWMVTGSEPDCFTFINNCSLTRVGLIRTPDLFNSWHFIQASMAASEAFLSLGPTFLVVRSQVTRPAALYPN